MLGPTKLQNILIFVVMVEKLVNFFGSAFINEIKTLVYVNINKRNENNEIIVTLNFLPAVLINLAKISKLNSCFHSLHLHSTEAPDIEMQEFSTKIFLHV